MNAQQVNAKHQAAVDATHERVKVLRADITDQLVRLVKLAAALDDLADTHQTTGLGLVTEQGRQARAKQTIADRAAARGLVGRNDTPGLGWMNPPIRLGTGQVEAPVTMPAVSAAAEIHHTLAHHVRRLSRPAVLAALEVEQTQADDHGYCPWPRPGVLGLAPNPEKTNLGQLVRALTILVANYTNRRNLEHLLRDLDHLEQTAKTVIDGPAATNHPDPCPWCDRHTLVIHHRAPGRDRMFIRCEGTHPCVCDDPWCDCHRHPHRNRHEWVHTGSAKNPVDGRTPHALTNLIRRAKEYSMLEPRAINALEQIRAIHAPVPYQPWVADCPNPNGHDNDDTWVDSDNDRGRICLACPPAATVCETCRDAAGNPATWPCDTAHACNLDTPTDTDN